MKKVIALVIVMACAMSMMAQEVLEKDVLVLKNNTKVECLIQEVSNSQIKYYKLSLPNGPVFIEDTDNLVAIMYRDGSVQTYENYTNPETMRKDPSIAAQYEDGEVAPKVAFQVNLELGAQFAVNRFKIENEKYDFPSGGCDLDVSLGARLTQLVFVGAGLGFHTEFANTYLKVSGEKYPIDMKIYTLPIYVDTRVYIPNKTIVTPYFLVNLGGYVPIVTSGEIQNKSGDVYNFKADASGGFYMQLGWGMEIKRFQMSIGYRLHTTDDAPGHYGFIKFGARLGRNVEQYKK